MPDTIPAGQTASHVVRDAAQGAGSRRFVALDSWRGICALAVALFHFPIAGPVAESVLVHNSYLFVDFFFILSGFVIATAYERRLSDAGQRGAFVIRRFGRLWPLHVTMLAVFIVAGVVNGQFGTDERHSVAAIFTNLALIHGLGVHHDVTWNGPSWSISVEAVLYLTFVGLSMVPWRLAIYVVLIAVGIFVLSFQAPHGMGSTFDYGIFRGLAGFFTGVIVARMTLRKWGTAVELLTIAAVIAFVGFSSLKVFAPLVFGAAVFVFAGSRGWINRLLNLPPFVKLGEWSYSIYMVHAAVVAGIWVVAGRLHLKQSGGWLVGMTDLQSCLATVGYLAVVVAISVVTYRFVETPGRIFFNRLAQRRRVAPLT